MTFDPQVSEWENPRGAMPAHPLLNQIGRREATRGTETSKYPEEEKSNESPPVAASERGRAQTRARASIRALLHGGSGAVLRGIRNLPRPVIKPVRQRKRSGNSRGTG